MGNTLGSSSTKKIFYRQDFCLLLEVNSKLFWSKIINQELISLWGPIIDASRILLNEWKNERGLNHYWMKVVNYGWQYSKEHPPPPLLLLMEPHVQKAKKLLLSMIEHKSRLGPIHLSFVWKNRLTLDFFYKTKIIFWRVFASFENQTFHFLGQNHDSILLYFEPHYSTQRDKIWK